MLYFNDTAAADFYSLRLNVKYVFMPFKHGEGRNFSLPESVQSSSGAHPSFCSVGIGLLLSGGSSGWCMTAISYLYTAVRSLMRTALRPIQLMPYCLVLIRLWNNPSSAIMNTECRSLPEIPTSVLEMLRGCFHDH
jgi:hypothetical protein